MLCEAECSEISLALEAIRTAQLSAFQMGWTKVIIHTDVKAIVDKIQPNQIQASLLQLLTTSLCFKIYLIIVNSPLFQGKTTNFVEGLLDMI